MSGAPLNELAVAFLSVLAGQVRYIAVNRADLSGVTGLLLKLRCLIGETQQALK